METTNVQPAEYPIGKIPLMAGAVMAVLQGRAIEHVSPDCLDPDPGNARAHFSPEELHGLIASIQANGIIQPLLVTRSSIERRYGIVAGHRRCAAAHLANLKTVPVIVLPQPLTPAQRLELQLIENLQRADLKPCSQEAPAYQTLIATHGYTLAQMETISGKDATDISRILKLLTLSPEVQAMIDAGERTKSAGYELTKIKNEAIRRHLCERFLNEPLTREQIAALAGSRARRRKAQPNHRPLKRVTLPLPGDIMLTVQRADTAAELTTQEILYKLEFTTQEARKACRKNVPIRALPDHFRQIVARGQAHDTKSPQKTATEPQPQIA